MANTPEGTPYVESSDLVANYPAASLALANRVDLVGVLPFADAAARTTAIPTPTDGQYSYLQDTNATEFYNGAAWVAAGTAPGLVRVATESFSAVSSVSLNGVFTSAYQNYFITAKTTFSSAEGFLFRMRASGADTTGSVYVFQSLEGSSSTASAVTGTQSVGYFGAGAGSTNFAISANCFDPQLAQNTFIHSQYRNIVPQTGIMSTQVNNSTQYDGITVYPGAGTMTGTIRVYGYANS